MDSTGQMQDIGEQSTFFWDLGNIRPRRNIHGYSQGPLQKLGTVTGITGCAEQENSHSWGQIALRRESQLLGKAKGKLNESKVRTERCKLLRDGGQRLG